MRRNVRVSGGGGGGGKAAKRTEALLRSAEVRQKAFATKKVADDVERRVDTARAKHAGEEARGFVAFAAAAANNNAQIVLRAGQHRSKC